MKEVEHRIVLTERTIEELDVSYSDAALPSCSDKQNNTIQAPFNQLSSTFKAISAILTTLSPIQTSATKAAIANSKKQRKRVQHRAGEVITEPEVMERLHKEEFERINKKKINFGAQAKYERNQKRKIHPTKEPYDRKIIKKSEMELLPGKWVLIEYKGKRQQKHSLVKSCKLMVRTYT